MRHTRKQRSATNPRKFAVKKNRLELVSMQTLHAQELHEATTQMEDSLILFDEETEKNDHRVSD